jgi:succinoglycan biosynthesis protein ExoM
VTTEAAPRVTPQAARTRRVCVAIPTYRRPDYLGALLTGLREIAVPPGYTVSAIVLDNDAAASAQAIVAARRDAFPFALDYAVVAHPGLVSVRNAALRYAGEQSFDFLAMIDDDEVPQAQWLAELLRVHARTRADAVVGPVPSDIPAGAPRWLVRGRFLDLPT